MVSAYEPTTVLAPAATDLRAELRRDAAAVLATARAGEAPIDKRDVAKRQACEELGLDLRSI